MGVSRTTAYRWWSRYQQFGEAGLVDRSSVPLRSPRRTAARLEQRILRLRQRELPIITIRADVTTVEPAGKPADAPAVERLRGRKLLYLGQSAGTVVLYDADADRAVYVPDSSIILHVANCDAKPPPDPTCLAVQDY
jgi:hypothetical protein